MFQICYETCSVQGFSDCSCSPHLNCPWSWTMKTVRSPFRRAEKLPDLPFPPFPGCYVGQARWCRSYGFGRLVCAGWATGQLVCRVKNHSVSTTGLSLLTPRESEPSVLIPAHSPSPHHRPSRSADAGTTQTGRSTSQGNTSVQQRKRRAVIMLM